MRITAFWNVTLCILLEIPRLFREYCCLHLQGGISFVCLEDEHDLTLHKTPNLKEICNVHSSTNAVRFSKVRKRGWTGQVARMRGIRKKWSGYLEHLGFDRGTVLNWFLKGQNVRV